MENVVEAQELERARLARELHDETGQALTSILLRLKQLEDAGEPEQMREGLPVLRELVSETLRNVRRLAVELRPAALDDFGLQPALERLVHGVAEDTGLRVDLVVSGLDDRLPTEIETALYRIVQEALTNVTKHAEARTVSIVITRKERSVVAVVEDDGRGLRSGPAGQSSGLGVVGMRERVALLGGTFTIESGRGAGVTLVVEVPVR
jgi:signal transduction histidine kinase